MTAARPQGDERSKRFLWGGATLVVLLGIGAYFVTSVPPAQSEEQALTITPSTQSDYARAVTISDGQLVVSRSEGLNGDLQTVVTFEVSGEPDNGNTNGPHLAARVFHDTGAVMVCKMGRAVNLRIEPRTYYLGCDRTVDLDKVGEWSTAELISCERLEVADELFRDAPCHDGW